MRIWLEPLICVQTVFSFSRNGTSRRTKPANLIQLQQFKVCQWTCLIHSWVSLSCLIRKIVRRILATPQNQALEVKNPRNVLRGLLKELQCTIDRLCDRHPAEIARHRSKSQAKNLESVEAKLEELMPSHCRQILINKDSYFFKEMLEERAQGPVPCI